MKTINENSHSYLVEEIDTHKLQFHPTIVSKWLTDPNSWDNIKRLNPIYMEVSPSGKCNHRCIFCAYDFTRYCGEFLNTSTFIKQLPEMSKNGLKSIMYAGEGEPFLHPDFPRLIQKTYLNNIDVGITTNGVLIPEDLNFLKYTSWIKISLNGTNPTEYSKIHNTTTKDFTRIMQIIPKLVRFKNKYTLKSTIGVQLVYLSQNISDIYNLCKQLKLDGIDYVVIKPFNSYLQKQLKLDINYTSQQINELYLKLITLNNSSFKINFRLNSFAAIKKQENLNITKCHAVPSFWSYMKSSGEIIGCYVHWNNKNFTWGNINSMSYKDILHSQNRKNCFYYIQNNLDLATCSGQCRMTQINKYLERLLLPNSHDNFI